MSKGLLLPLSNVLPFVFCTFLRTKIIGFGFNQRTQAKVVLKYAKQMYKSYNENAKRASFVKNFSIFHNLQLGMKNTESWSFYCWHVYFVFKAWFLLMIWKTLGYLLNFILIWLKNILVTLSNQGIPRTTNDFWETSNANPKSS